MFGLSLGEIVLLLIVGIVVVGPKNLPTMMRSAGHWVTKLRRMSTDLRAQSGIDDLIKSEGLEREIHELRSLSRMNVVDSFITPALARVSASDPYAPALPSAMGPRPLDFTPVAPLREREYPLVGCDAHGALADDAGPFHGFVEAARAKDEPPAAEPADTATAVVSDSATVPTEAFAVAPAPAPAAEAATASDPATPAPAADLAPGEGAPA